MFSFAPSALFNQVNELQFPPIVRSTYQTAEPVTATRRGLHAWTFNDLPWLANGWDDTMTAMVEYVVTALRRAGENFFDPPPVARLLHLEQLVTPEPAVAGESSTRVASFPTSESFRLRPESTLPASPRRSPEAGPSVVSRGGYPQGLRASLLHPAEEDLPPVATLATPTEPSVYEEDDEEDELPEESQPSAQTSSPPHKRRKGKGKEVARGGEPVTRNPNPRPVASTMMRTRSHGDPPQDTTAERRRTTRPPDHGVPVPLTASASASSGKTGLRIHLPGQARRAAQGEEEGPSEPAPPRRSRRLRRVESEEPPKTPLFYPEEGENDFGQPVLLMPGGRGEYPSVKASIDT